MTAGHSWRTPAKHALMDRFVSREIRALNSLNRLFGRGAWFDLAAGDGIATHGTEWRRACSPGILAGHAATTTSQLVGIKLYEKDPVTYETLLTSLATQLPLLGYDQTDENVWEIDGKVWLEANNDDGHKAKLDRLKTTDAVLVLNDPNVITDWAMRRRFAAEIVRRCKGLRILSTLGTNVGGGKRAPLSRPDTLPFGDDEPMSLKERAGWFGLVKEQQDALPERHDLLLATFERDSDQWAYLLSVPGKDPWPEQAEKDVRDAFQTVGQAGRMAWFRRTPDRFEKIKADLFYTKSERFERENTPLWEDGGGALLSTAAA